MYPGRIYNERGRYTGGVQDKRRNKRHTVKKGTCFHSPCRCVAWDVMDLEDMAAVSTADGHSTTGISRPAGYAVSQQDSQNNEFFGKNTIFGLEILIHAL